MGAEALVFWSLLSILVGYFAHWADMELGSSLNSDTVQDLRPKDPVVVSPAHTIGRTIAIMQEAREGCVLICDESGKPVGIFTERDVLRRVIGEQMSFDLPIKEAMSTDLATIGANDTAMEAIRLLHARGLRHLPVVSPEGKPVGIVSVRRIMEYVVEHNPRAVYSQPPERFKSLDSREGA